MGRVRRPLTPAGTGRNSERPSGPAVLAQTAEDLALDLFTPAVVTTLTADPRPA
ncbi:hypothetical protein [Nonomuraea sp. NPDC050540]|uniref:hypothetical protein n=1 Tax=Nonomuraea sp. NPDC050540 TaxID=3364367 RepID=UPI00379FD1B8